ncbi:MAG: anaerobic ribonucleoside-triphosphate reductase activating protein [Lachnospiraceae bacterium]|nr:anaerobic ribonucleoside-triphosphate reductase activating protein [Lachnospiraceae bacterium]
MNIQGLQKLTLLDFPGRVACTVFFGGCDFRCPYCHNSELIGGVPAAIVSAKGRGLPVPTIETHTVKNTPISPETIAENAPLSPEAFEENAPLSPGAITEEEFFRFLEKRRGLLDGVAVTGGEPVLHRDLPDFLARIRDMGFAVKLDTNGNHPGMLSRILDGGLADYVAMDIKNSPGRYGKTIGIPEFDTANISRSISLLLNSTIEYEFRTTVVAEFHDESVFPAIGQWIRGAKRYYLQCFVDRDTVPQKGLHAPSHADMQRYAELVRPYVQHAELRGV